MAATETTGKVAPEPIKAEPPSVTKYFALVEVVLRFLLFASALVAVLVLVTSKQTKRLQFPPFPLVITMTAKFNQSPAFIYLVAALSVTGFYAVISTLLSFYSLLKPGYFTKALSHFVVLDVLLLGILASATGAAGGVAYIGLKGDSQVGWMKVFNIYGKFCRHVGASIAISLFGSIVLVLLVLLSVYSLSKKIPK
ncbi:CASP-like protein 1 [Dorcoceras hygrometricum]|uniref:CASP-like protein n=1 Tax=Dorcoceras hygrometricum TaxID=472368 RepID=A0A2Z7C9X9_9LAMI|nr:CASP-like protein 1 [Dorcoceras hygrometricum]